MNAQPKRSMAGKKHNLRSVDAPDAADVYNLVQVSEKLDEDDVKFLKRWNIGLYQPLVRKLKPVPRNKLSHSQRRSGHRPMREEVEALFPGYALVNFTSAGEFWREIFKMKRVRGLATANNLPIQVDARVINEFKKCEIDGALPGAMKLFELPFVVGQHVRVTDGPFSGFPGVVEELPLIDREKLSDLTLQELDDSYRVKLCVDIFGRGTPVSLEITQIEKL